MKTIDKVMADRAKLVEDKTKLKGADRKLYDMYTECIRYLETTPPNHLWSRS